MKNRKEIDSTTTTLNFLLSFKKRFVLIADQYQYIFYNQDLKHISKGSGNLSILNVNK